MAWLDNFDYKHSLQDTKSHHSAQKKTLNEVCGRVSGPMVTAIMINTLQIQLPSNTMKYPWRISYNLQDVLQIALGILNISGVFLSAIHRKRT